MKYKGHFNELFGFDEEPKEISIIPDEGCFNCDHFKAECPGTADGMLTCQKWQMTLSK